METEDGGTESTARLKRVHCPRVDAQLTPSEHAACPYCHGTQEAIRSGYRVTFCDFDPDRDPTHFGFPDDFGRYFSG